MDWIKDSIFSIKTFPPIEQVSDRRFSKGFLGHGQVRGLLKGDLVDFAHYEEKITVGET